MLSDPALLDQGVDHGLAQALDVDAPLRGEMLHAAPDLRRDSRDSGSAARPPPRTARPWCRTPGIWRENVGRGIRRAAVLVHADHRRDDLAGLLHVDVVADADVLAGDLVALCSVARDTVVPASTTGSSSATGVSTPVRPDLHRDRLEAGLGPLGREFVGDGPARRLRGAAGLALLRQRVEFDHRAVGGIGEPVPQLVEFLHRRPCLVDAVRGPELLHPGQAPGLTHPWRPLWVPIGPSRGGFARRPSSRLQRRLAEAEAVEDDLKLAAGDLARRRVV